MPPPELKPLQVDWYDGVRAARAAGARIIVCQAATGFGKNTVAGYFARRCYDMLKHALLLVHRRKLVDQIGERLQQFEVPHGVLMRGQHYDRYQAVNVASRDTFASRCLDNCWEGMPPADLVIVDEAHHAAGPKSQYRRILDFYRTATILLLSATPVGPDGRGLGPWAQAIVCSAPTSQLVREGYLVPVKCYAPDRKHKNGKVRRGIAGDLVSSWQDYAEDKATVLFSSRVAHSLEAVQAFEDAGIPAVHLDADTPDDTRERAFEGLADGSIKVVSNVGIIGEGVDVPELACCQLWCEVGSRTRFLQACGRIMRPAPGKAHGILIDHSGAVFRHGFPDEDTEWSLAGDVDADFAAKHDAGETEKAYYCRICELVYHGSPACPQCGREPAKPPRSIFAPPPVDSSNELLTEVDREEKRPDGREEKVRHWFRCLAVAVKRDNSFGMAAQVYKQKYREWPGDDFPCMPNGGGWKQKVKEAYPDFGRRRESV